MKDFQKILLCLLLFFNNLYHQNYAIDEETKSNVVQYVEKWQPIEGILKYRLEILDMNRQLVFAGETENTEILVELIPGIYKKRLGLINKFNQIFLWTDWFEFEIKEIPIPKIQYIEEKMIISTIEKDTLQVSIDGMIEKTKIYLENPKDGQKIEVPFKQIDTNRIELLISPKNLTEGKYNLLVLNSEKKFGRITDAVKITSLLPKEESKVFQYQILIPGLLQRENKEYQKANFIQGGFIASILIGAYAYENTKRWEQNFNILFQQYQIANSRIIQFPLNRNSYGIVMNLILLEKLNRYIKQIEQHRNLFLLSSFVGIGMYTYHLIDVRRFDLFVSPKDQKIEFLLKFTFDSTDR